MASIIKIKRSTGVAAPSSLKSGELAYSYGAGTSGNLGDRLFFGSGDDGSGNATSVAVIGGKYFADMLDHTPGTLTASSAIIVDASSKVNQLLVDNLKLDGNTLSSTNTGGNVVINPDGSGTVDVNSSRITSVSTPTSSSDAATKGYVDQVSGASDLTINDGGSGTDTVNLTDSSLTFAGGTGLTTTVTNNTVTIDIDNTGVTAGTYGSGNAIPQFTVNAQGQIDSVSTVSIETDFTISDGSNTDTFNIGETLTFTGTAPITTTVSDNQVTIAANDATTSTKGIASFNSDDFTVSSGGVSVKSAGISNVQLENNDVTINGTGIALGDSATFTTTDIDEGSNQYYTTARADSAAKNAINVTHVSGDGDASYDPATGAITITGPSAAETRAHFSAGTGVNIDNGEISIGQAVDSTDDVIFNDLRTTGGVTVDGDLTVHGTTTTVNSVTVTTNDPLMHLADSNETTDAVDIGFVAQYYNTDNSRVERTGFFRDATDNTYKLFSGLVQDDLDTNNTVSTSDSSFAFANIRVGTLTASNIAGTSFSGSYAGFDSDFAAKTTDDLTEGTTNLYYSSVLADSDAKNAISVQSSTGLSYNPSTGVISGVNATTSIKGVASFNGTHFSTSNGNVSAQNITIVTGDANSKAFTLGSSINLNGSSTAGITTSTTGGNLVVSAVNASTTQRGTASFDSDNFTVTTGEVSIVSIDGGTY